MVRPGSIVQIDPMNGPDLFRGCLAVVSEVKPHRIMAYVQSAAVSGQAYVFLEPGQYEETGGTAVWVAQ
jgi:hypothetical protein